MSDRAGFASQVVYCPDCLAKLKEWQALCAPNDGLVVSDGYERVCSGMVKHPAEGHEATRLVDALVKFPSPPCHQIEFVVLAENGAIDSVVVMPTGGIVATVIRNPRE